MTLCDFRDCPKMPRDSDSFPGTRGQPSISQGHQAVKSHTERPQVAGAPGPAGPSSGGQACECRSLQVMPAPCRSLFPWRPRRCGAEKGVLVVPYLDSRPSESMSIMKRWLSCALHLGLLVTQQVVTGTTRTFSTTPTEGSRGRNQEGKARMLFAEREGDS